MRCGPSSGYFCAKAEAAVRNPAFLPITTPIYTPGKARLSRLTPVKAEATKRAAEP